MAATEIKVQMQQRRDTAANWTSTNPTLLSGEFGYETDTGKFKVGDGSTVWTSLAYIPGFSISGYPLATTDIADGSITSAKLDTNIDVAGTFDVTGAATFDNNLTVQGDLTVNGTTTTIDTTTLTVEDKNIELGVVTTPTDVTADGGGITLKGATDHTIIWTNSTDSWDFSEHVNIATGKEFQIAGTKVLDATSLGSAVVSSSLTSVGTITTGTWNGTAIATAYIADDAVTADKLADTAVTAGSYTAADITVDAQGRITAAASGTIGTSEIADGSITSAKLDTNIAVAGTLDVTGVISADGKVKFPAGTAAAPSFYSGTDTDTGLYFSAADEVSVATGGTQRVVVDSSGNVGIGTTGPSSLLSCHGGTLGSTSGDTVSLFDLYGPTSNGDFLKFELERTSNGSDWTTAAHKIYRQVDVTAKNFIKFGFDSLSFGIGSSQHLLLNGSGQLILGSGTPGDKLTIGDTSDSFTAIRIQSTNTGIGEIRFGDSDSSNPAYLKYEHTGNNLIFAVNASERMRIDSSGRLLVGKSTSQSILGYQAGVQFATATGTSSFVRNTADTGAPEIVSAKSRGTSGTPAIVQDGDGLWLGRFAGYDGSSYVEAARISAIVDGTPGTNDMPGALLFSTTADGSASPSERMRIDSSGNVGIGTTVPVGRLEVQRDGTGNLIQVWRSDMGTNNRTVTFSSPDTDSSTEPFYWNTGNSYAWHVDATERMRIDSSGNVGIGTTSPDVKLDVVQTGSTSSIIRTKNDTTTVYLDANNGYAYLNTFTNHPLLFGTNNTERMRIDSNGNLLHNTTITTPGIGNTSTGICLERASDGGTVLVSRNENIPLYLNRNNNGVIAQFRRSGSIAGWISVTTTSASYNSSSDYRLKENVIGIADGITRVKQLQPKRFNFIADDTTTVDGFLAHEAQTVVPEAVTGTHNEVDDDGNPVYQGLDQSKLVPLLTAALQEAIAKIETLEAKVAALEAG